VLIQRLPTIPFPVKQKVFREANLKESITWRCFDLVLSGKYQSRIREPFSAGRPCFSLDLGPDPDLISDAKMLLSS
jgi:hypothetical protein